LNAPSDGRKKKPRDKRTRNIRHALRQKEAELRVSRSSMAQYDSAMEACTDKQVQVDKRAMSKVIILYDLETSSLSRDHSEILQVSLILPLIILMVLLLRPYNPLNNATSE
jgi:hypothetical protein